MKEQDKNICCICKKPYQEIGHNAEPYEKGWCCDKCNKIFVIPFRINGIESIFRRIKEQESWKDIK